MEKSLSEIKEEKENVNKMNQLKNQPMENNVSNKNRVVGIKKKETGMKKTVVKKYVTGRVNNNTEMNATISDQNVSGNLNHSLNINLNTTITIPIERNKVANPGESYMIYNHERHSSNRTAISTKQRNINDDTFYLDKENSIILRDYGSEVYRYAREELEQDDEIPEDFMKRHKINKEIRTKMVDWIVEVLSVYKNELDTFFLAVNIMDRYIYLSGTVLTSQDIHLIGMTCMFIASKQEDVIPIRMHSIVSKIGHNQFEDNQIRAKEKLILNTIGFESLIGTSIYEFIKTYFFDFRFNNKDNVKKLKIAEVVNELEECSVFLAMLIMYFDEFYAYKNSLKAVACVISSFDIVRANSKYIRSDGESFLRDWIMFVIQESYYDNETISTVYYKVVDYYKKYESISHISQNLIKYRPLKFQKPGYNLNK